MISAVLPGYEASAGSQGHVSVRSIPLATPLQFGAASASSEKPLSVRAIRGRREQGRTHKSAAVQRCSASQVPGDQRPPPARAPHQLLAGSESWSFLKCREHRSTALPSACSCQRVFSLPKGSDVGHVSVTCPRCVRIWWCHAGLGGRCMRNLCMVPTHGL